MSETQVTLLKLAGVVVLVLLNGFFVAAEFALVKTRSTRLALLAKEGRFGARVALRLLSNINAYLSAAQLGITLASLGLGWLAESALADLFTPCFHAIQMGKVAAHATSASLVFAIITFLHIVAGEQAPKVLAIQKSEQTSLIIAWPLRLFHSVIYPAIWILNNASLGLLKLFGIKPANEHETVHSADELRALLKQSSRNQQLTPVAGSLLLNALDLRRRKARQVMVHRTKIASLSTRLGIEENLRIAQQSGHSRFPLCNGSIDHVVGMIHLKDLMWLIHEKRSDANLNSIKRDVLFIPETIPLERLLNTFLTQRIHMAIVVNEYGSIVGMITLENILEEIVGDIQDEFDQEALMFQKISATEYRLHGELPLHDLENLLGLSLPAEEVTTIGGYMVKELGHFPQSGENLLVGNYEFSIQRSTGRQILQIVARELPPQPDQEKIVLS
ncbi:MAG: hemolysin family protein [Verrucomicrobiae bacterium]|nr:hemolysin family protein [Verrucomicrobiae bacterium]